jgi:hypothetical protein
MPDERLDSIRQGLGVPPESQVGRDAARKKQDQAAEETPIERGMGGTSDAETAPQESQMNQSLYESEDGRDERR